MKGEFEKQIKRYDYDAILAYMDINEAMKTKWITHNDFLKLIDNAKKEFPRLTPQIPMSMIRVNDYIHNELEPWLEKWFGGE